MKIKKIAESIIKNFGALIIGLFVVFFLSELSLRVYQKVSHGIALTDFLIGYKETRFQLSPFLVFGPRINYQLLDKDSPETAYFNFQGFRTTDTVGLKTKDEYRIITLGGSTTENVWNKKGIHWPMILEQELDHLGKGNIRVYNAAMSGYSSAHSLVNFQFNLIEYQPDLIIVMHNINDLNVNYHAVKHDKTVDSNYLIKYGQKFATGEIDESDIVVSRLVNSISLRIKSITSNGQDILVPQYDIALGKKYFKRNLKNIYYLSKENNIKLVLLTMPFSSSQSIFEKTKKDLMNQPSVGFIPDYENFMKDLSDYNDAIRELCQEEGIFLVDMAQLFPSQDNLFVDWVHYTTEGVNVFGETLAIEFNKIL